MSYSDGVQLSGARKAAIMLSVLSEEAAATLIRDLNENEMQRVAEEVANLGTVPVEVSLQVIEEYQRMVQAQDYLVQGGYELARRLLTKALASPSRRYPAAADQGSGTQALGVITAVRPAEARQVSGSEHPQTIALVLGQLGDRQASALLMNLPNDTRAEAVKRLANLRRFSPELAEKVSTMLSQKLKTVGEQGKRAYSGFQSVADIMNCIDTTVAQEILENIENEEPTLAISIRDLMFTFADLLQVGESHIR